VGAGLIFGVGDDPDVRLAGFERGAERKGERADGRFGGAARAEEVEFEGRTAT
jgi:hypothetical protein